MLHQIYTPVPTFWMRGNDIESISVISGLYPDSRAQFYAPVFKLQEFLSAVEIKPDYINMNIEGSEEVLIENYDFKHKPDTWAIETHRNMTSPWKIASILEKNGYSTVLNPPDANDPHTMVMAYLR